MFRDSRGLKSWSQLMASRSFKPEVNRRNMIGAGFLREIWFVKWLSVFYVAYLHPSWLSSEDTIIIVAICLHVVLRSYIKRRRWINPRRVSCHPECRCQTIKAPNRKNAKLFWRAIRCIYAGSMAENCGLHTHKYMLCNYTTTARGVDFLPR